ncbi:MAG: PPC domain-containing protein, partial [Myxococcota bacterium]|nr:PPC domain-containing protein [Myxococcota bacterium]
RIRTESDTDVDLYVRFANPPTTSDYDARGYTVSGDETIDFDANEAGELHIGVHGWITSDYSLNTAAR